MEFFEDERPRFLFQGRAAASSSSSSGDAAGILKVGKLHAFACLVSGLLLILLAYISLSGTETLASLLLWVALSLLLAPFTPISITGGDARVGVGEPVLVPDPVPASSDLDDEPGRRIAGRRARSQKPAVDATQSLPATVVPAVLEAAAEDNIKDPNFTSVSGRSEDRRAKEDVHEEEKEWTDADLEVLKKQVSKYPVGAPKRWERIAEAFQGRHGLDSVIRTAKSMSERRPGSEDSFQQFLKQRKPVDKRVETMEGDVKDGALAENGELRKENGGEGGSWNAGEDIALLNALKAFPKDVPMRWEKIAASVPGKAKAACMKRVAELKRDFRSSKAS